jgi:hypothetical protein
MYQFFGLLGTLDGQNKKWSAPNKRAELRKMNFIICRKLQLRMFQMVPTSQTNHSIALNDTLMTRKPTQTKNLAVQDIATVARHI